MATFPKSTHPDYKKFYYYYQSDPVFKARIDALGFSGFRRMSDSEPTKEAIREFYDLTGRLPSQFADDLEEKKKGRSLRSYCSPSHGCFDPKINVWARERGLKRNTAKRVRNKTTGIIFESAAAAAKQLGLSSCAVSTGIFVGNKIGGHYWEYVC